MNVVRTWRTESCALREKSAYAPQEFEARKKLMNSFGRIRGENDGKEEMYLGKMLILFHCLMMLGSEGDELTSVRYVECVRFLSETDEALRCVGLQSETAGSRKKHDTGKEGKNTDCSAEDKKFGLIPVQSAESTMCAGRANVYMRSE